MKHRVEFDAGMRGKRGKCSLYEPSDLVTVNERAIEERNQPDVLLRVDFPCYPQTNGQRAGIVDNAWIDYQASDAAGVYRRGHDRLEIEDDFGAQLETDADRIEQVNWSPMVVVVFATVTSGVAMPICPSTWLCASAARDTAVNANATNNEPTTVTGLLRMDTFLFVWAKRLAL